MGVLVRSPVGRGEGLRAKLAMEKLDHLGGDVPVVPHEEVRRAPEPTQLCREV